MMTRVITILSVMAIGASALAGARIDLRPTMPMPPEGYAPNTIIDVEAYFVDTGNPQGDITFSHISLDVTETLALAGVEIVQQEDAICCGCPANFAWNSGPCAAQCFTCPNAVQPSWFAFEATNEFVLPDNGELYLGFIRLNVGADSFVLDVVNADDPMLYHGAYAHIDAHHPGDPELMWTAYDGDFTGGQLEIVVTSGFTNTLVWSDPPYNAIDARQPTNLNGSDEHGWGEVQLEFANTVCIPLDFEFFLAEAGDDGLPPWVNWVTYDSPTEVGVILSDPIDPGAWTTITHLPSGAVLRLGYLPGDVNADGTTSPQDILALIDSLNGVTVRPIWSTDIDRSGVANPADILRLIDLLNGAEGFDVWNGATLPE